MSKKSNQSFKIGDVYDETIAALPIQERLDVLEGICYKVTNESYTKQLSSEELSDKKSRLAEVSIQISELEEKKKEIMAELKAEMTEPAQEKTELLTAIKFKREDRKGMLYYMDDQEESLMYVFDDTATCIEVRPLRGDEKQTKIRNLNQVSNG